MNKLDLAKRPHVLGLNRVERLYVGGKLLDEWQGLENGQDSTMSEEFIASTVEYMGPMKDVIDKGISRTVLDDHNSINLKDLINLDKAAFLGEKYKDKCADGQIGVLARVGDTIVRLVIQVHPTAQTAKQFFNYPSGKSEAWYIVNTREIDGVHPYVYAGFKKHVTKALWRELFEKQDVKGMLDCMHKIDVNAGDMVLIESGMPHAMGAGSLFLEIHEACDYTIRLEKNYAVRPLKDDELHYGVGYDAMFEMFTYDTYTDEEIRKKVMPEAVREIANANGTLSTILDYDATDKFMIKRLDLKGTFTIPDFDGHYIMITTKGATTLHYDGGSVSAEQGRGIFVPAGCKQLKAEGSGELIIGYPFKV